MDYKPPKKQRAAKGLQSLENRNLKEEIFSSYDLLGSVVTLLWFWACRKYCISKPDYVPFLLCISSFFKKKPCHLKSIYNTQILADFCPAEIVSHLRISPSVKTTSPTYPQKSASADNLLPAFAGNPLPLTSHVLGIC